MNKLIYQKNRVQMSILNIHKSKEGNEQEKEGEKEWNI